jgi:phosphoglucosamine mutase
MKKYPQKQINVPAKEKRPLDRLAKFQQVVYKCQRALGGEGRTLIRYSGTENKLRILVESADAEATEHWARALAEAARAELA